MPRRSKAIGRCLSFVRIACEGQGGRVVKTIGDEIMAVFPGADQAAEAAARDAGAHLANSRPSARLRLAIRVGFHFGPAIAVEGDVFGDSVNVAARMTALAKGEQVILSAATAGALSPLAAVPRPGDRFADGQGQAGGDRHLRVDLAGGRTPT